MGFALCRHGRKVVGLHHSADLLVKPLQVVQDSGDSSGGAGRNVGHLVLEVGDAGVEVKEEVLCYGRTLAIAHGAQHCDQSTTYAVFLA